MISRYLVVIFGYALPRSVAEDPRNECCRMRAGDPSLDGRGDVHRVQDQDPPARHVG